MSNVTLKTMGSLANAQAIAGRVERAVPAYRQFIRQREWAPDNPFPTRPVVDKASYLLAFPFDQLVGEDFEQTFTIFKSSGSSGHSFYWPQLKDAHRTSAPNFCAAIWNRPSRFIKKRRWPSLDWRWEAGSAASISRGC